MGITTSRRMNRPLSCISRSSVVGTEPPRLFSTGRTTSSASLEPTAAAAASMDE